MSNMNKPSSRQDKGDTPVLESDPFDHSQYDFDSLRQMSIAEHLIKGKLFINGEWRDAASGGTYPVLNPADSKAFFRVADAAQDDADEAINAAHQAFLKWSKVPAKVRAEKLRIWFELIIENQHSLAVIMTLESGKPLNESKSEVTYGASFVEWFAEEAKRINGDLMTSVGADRKVMVSKQAVGVCTAITPWNFPLAMITRKCAPALAAGCSVVVKPAEDTPMTALALAALAEQAGFPAGVFNVISASSGISVGKVLTTHPLVKKVSFTGSTEVGKLLIKQSADTVKRVSMELGGNAPFIVFDDAKLNKAVEGAIASKYRNSGQTCICANRFIVQAGIYDKFVEALAVKSRQLMIGNGMAPGTQQGPLINETAVTKVKQIVDDAVASGARVLTGGKVVAGNFFQPTVLVDVDESMDIVNQEIFGPVCPVIKFETEEEAIALANATPYGLAAYVYTKKHKRIWRVSDALDYGMIGINEGIISTEIAPFGGMKESGIGREGGEYGLDEYLELKYLCMGGLD